MNAISSSISNGGLQVPIDSSAKTPEFNAWVDKTAEKVLSWNTSEKEILDIFKNEVGGSNSNPNKMVVLQYLLGLRTKMIATFTDVMKQLHDTAMRIIQNLR